MRSGNPSSGSNNNSGGGGGGGGGPCGACKFLRRKCVSDCVFAPYFEAEEGAAFFAAVHKVFGASNVSKLLLLIPPHRRPDAVASICYEAQARLRDPVYGCVAHIFNLQQQVVNLQTELSFLQAHLATVEVPQPPPHICISDLPTISPATDTNDMSSILDPTVTVSSSSSLWAMQQQPRSSDHHPSSSSVGSSGGDFQTLAHECLRGGQGPEQAPGTTGSASSTIIKRE